MEQNSRRNLPDVFFFFGLNEYFRLLLHLYGHEIHQEIDKKSHGKSETSRNFLCNSLLQEDK